MFSKKNGTNFATLICKFSCKANLNLMKKKLLTFQKFTAGSLAIALLFLATAGKILTSSKKVSDKALTEQKAKSEKQKAPTVVQELSLEAVFAPAISFDFQQDFYFLPQIGLVELVRESTPKQFDIFYYFFSYFRNVFGLYIAINAP